LRLLEDSTRTRERYAQLVAHFPHATVYHTPQWLSVWERLGAELAFVEVDGETMVPFVCRGQGALRRAFSLPFDTYGGPVTAAAGAPVLFENTIAPLGRTSARVVDFGACMASVNGAARPMSTHVVDLSDGYAAAASRYSDSNQRLIRQAAERGVRVDVLDDARGIGQFHLLHARTVARYDARALPRAFFDAVFATLVPAGLATFYLARRGDDVVAANLVLRHRDRACDWMWVYDDRFPQLRATNLLIDRAVRDEAARGTRELNLGASPNDRLGSVRFKHGFGAAPFRYTVYAHTGPLVGMARYVRSRVGHIGARVRLIAGE
jgi:CelD/BcsL family acetyltransferase involved in cellulose biosynthesis